MSDALYRPGPAADWQEVEIIGRHRSGALVLREVGRPLPGVMLGYRDQVRLPESPADRLLRKLRRAGVA